MESGVRVKSFSEVFAGREVNFYILCMKQSFLLWAGTDTSFTALSVAMNTRFVCHVHPASFVDVLNYLLIQGDDPISTQLLGDAKDSESSSLSKRLGKCSLQLCKCYHHAILCV